MSVPTLRELVADALEQADERALGRLLVGVSVHTEAERSRLRKRGRPFVDPDAERRPSDAELVATSEWLIGQAGARAGLVGAVAGLSGLVSVPPEALAQLVALLRLAQRLAIVHGFDPEGDRGQMAVWQALAAGFEIALPEQGPMTTRLTELPAALVSRDTVPNASLQLARSLALGSVFFVARRLGRLVPVLASGVAGRGGAVRTQEIGERMRRVYARLAEADGLDPARIADAVEV